MQIEATVPRRVPAITNFASDEVAVAAKNPMIAAALAARARLDAAFAA